MSDRGKKPGPAGKGARTPKTVRFPDAFLAMLEAEAEEAGYGDNFSEFVVMDMATRRRARLAEFHRGQLPLGA